MSRIASPQTASTGPDTQVAEPEPPLRAAHPSRGRQVIGWFQARPALATLVAYHLLSFLLFANVWRSPWSERIGFAGGDPDLGIWTMRWGPFALSHLHNPFFSNYVFAPEGINLAWNGSPALGVVLWPVGTVLGWVFTYNLAMTMSLALSAWCMYLAIRRLIPGHVGAFAGGLFYGFSPYMTAHATSHLQLTLAFIPPLMVIALHEAMVRQRWSVWRTGAMLGILATVQLLIFLEMLATEAITAVIVLSLVAVTRPRSVAGRLTYATRSVLVGLGVIAVTAAVPLRTLVFGAQSLLGHRVHAPNVFVNDLLGFVLPTQFHSFAPASAVDLTSRFTGGTIEASSYIGIPILLAVLFAVIRLRHDRVVVISAAAAGILALLSLGPHLRIGGNDTGVRLPGLLLPHLPLMSNVLPVRFTLYVDLFVAIVVAALVGHLLRTRWPERLAGLGTIAVGLLAVLPALPVVSAPVTTPAFFTNGDAVRIPEGSVALVAPFAGYARASSIDSESWQSASDFRFRMPEGYGFVPPDPELSGPQPTAVSQAMLSIQDGAASPVLTPAQRARMLGEIQRWGVRTVIVGPMNGQQGTVHLFTDLLGRPPEKVDGVEIWEGVAPG